MGPMASTPQNQLTPAVERARLQRSGTLHWIHWLVVALSGVLTVAAYGLAQAQVQDKVNARFQRESSQVVELVSDRLQHYEDGLWGGVGAIRASGDRVDQASWRAFAQTLRIERKYPGINGVGVILQVREEDRADYLERERRTRPTFRIHPPHDGPEFMPITYIEPEATNARAVGLDMAHEQNRYAAAKRARDTGSAQITGPIVLVQDAERTPGFLFYAPFYRGGPPSAPEARRARFAGMVYAPFVVKKLMEGVLAKQSRNVRVRIRDGSDTLYNELEGVERDFDPDPLFKRQVDLALYGRTWQFDVWASRSFRESAASTQPATILAGGIAIDLLLFLLFVGLTRANRRAVEFVDAVSAQLEREKEALEATSSQLRVTNRDLERFVYAASHDLRSPLRGVDNLCAWITEDLGESIDPEVKHQLALMRTRITRMDGLLDGLLEFSRLQEGGGELGLVSRDTVEAIVHLIEPPRGLDVVLEWGVEPFETLKGALELVFRNLIGNAVKHHDRATGQIVVRALDEGEVYTFEVSDDGPGIEPEFREQVFEMFETLRTRDEIEGSGMGLALVKKVIQERGGVVELHSNGPRGSRFRFTWPKLERGQEAA